MSTQPQSVAEIANKPKGALKVWAFDVPVRMTVPGADGKQINAPIGERYGGKDNGFTLRIPSGARVMCGKKNTRSLSAQIRVLVNPEMPYEERYFYVGRTNFPLPSPEPEFKGLQYVDTWDAWGEFWDLWEVTR